MSEQPPPPDPTKPLTDSQGGTHPSPNDQAEIDAEQARILQEAAARMRQKIAEQKAKEEQGKK